MRHLLLALVVLSSAGVACADPSLVAELEVVATRYHQDPARLDAVREGLERAAGSRPAVDILIALARVSFIWGDVRATSVEQKLEAYERGRQAARRAIEHDPRSAAAHFWFATNTARWGQTRGVLRSLVLLPTVQEEIRAVLEERLPTNPADWALKDSPEARALLESLRGRPS
jgi:hypothetical protein